MLDRLPPHEVEVEMAVIGCCLLDPKRSISTCEEKLTDGADAFYDLRHQILYSELRGMHRLSQDIDPLTLGAWLGPQFAEVGGHAYLNECQDKVPSTANLEYYIDILLEKKTLRKIIANCTRIASQAHEHSGNLDSLLEDLEKNVLSATATNQPTIALNGQTAGDRMSDDLERRFALNGQLSGLDCGLTDLNKKIEGLQFGEQMVIGARPSMGKTALGLKMFVNLAVQNKVPSLFVSLEMSTEAVMRRILSMLTDIPLTDIKRGSYSESDFKKFISTRALCCRSPMFLIDGVSGKSCREICAAVRRMVIKEGIKLVVIDYLQKVRCDSKQEKKTYEIGDVSGRLKGLAVETNVAMVTLAQLNRESTKDKGRRPRLSDLADSGQIERDADAVVLIHRENNQTFLILAKQRDGETGLIPVYFNGSCVRFENARYGEDAED